MMTRAIALTFALLVAPMQPSPAVAQGTPAPISEAEAHAIGVQAYVYFYSLITMDLTRKQSTNIEAGKEIGKGPMNTFVNVPEFPPADMKLVVRPNFDTLYSVAWLDVTKEPAVISVPDTSGRYYLLPMLDMWTDVFASPGWRTTGTQAGHFLVTPPGWRPDLRERFIDEFKLPKDTQRIEAPTPIVWIIGRTKTDGPSDYEAVRKIQAGFKLTPLSEWGKTAKPVEVKIDPSIDMKTPPKIQVDTMPAAKYFAYAAELLKTTPPHITDEPIIALLRKIGFEPGKSFDLDKAPPAVRSGLASAPAAARQLMEWKVPTLARVANHWSLNTDTMGVYGNYYLKRAIVAQLGLGANLPEDAIYPLNLGDEIRPSARRCQQVCAALREGHDAAGRCVLVGDVVRSAGLSSRQQPQPLRGEQLDAVQVQPRRLARSLFPEREPGQGQGAELAPRPEGAVQPDHAPLCAEIRCAHRPLGASGDQPAGRSLAPHGAVTAGPSAVAWLRCSSAALRGGARVAAWIDRILPIIPGFGGNRRISSVATPGRFWLYPRHFPTGPEDLSGQSYAAAGPIAGALYQPG